MYWCICPPIQLTVFLFCWWFPLLCKTFSVWCSPICLFFLLFSLPEEVISEKYCYEQCLRFYCLFTFRIFTVLDRRFKSLIHFELILVCGIRRWSSFIFLHIICQIFPTQFIEKPIFSPLYVLASSVKY